MGRFGRQPFIIADECDELEGSLMGHVEFSTPGGREMDRLGMTVPVKGAHKPTVIRWLRETFTPHLQKVVRGLNKRSIEDMRKATRYARMIEDASWVARELEMGDDTDEEAALWVRNYDDRDEGKMSYVPVVVDRYGPTKLWRHGQKWLCMSASIISPEEQVESLGLAGLKWATVEVPMRFNVDNRPIIAAPVARVGRKEMNEAIPKLAVAIGRLCQMEKYRGERVLVHTVSYKMSEDIKWKLQGEPGMQGRLVLTYRNSGERDEAFSRYARTPGAVLLAPSMDRGFDFKDDLARLVIIAKVPFPNLGDRQVSARLRLPERDGELWYRVQTVRTIVQMTGRGVRNETDWAHTYILDSEFVNNVWKKSKMLFPKWWRDAVDMTFATHTLRD
jgi:Rad3-related DNA helicase